MRLGGCPAWEKAGELSLLRCGRAVVAELCGRALVAAVWLSCCCRDVGELLLPSCVGKLLLPLCVSMVLMNVMFASSRKVAKKGVDVNVHAEEAASDRELRGLRELRELAQKGNQN